MVTHLLFDLDGTLVDSSPGIFRCARAVLYEMGLPDAPDAALREFIGPPLAHSLSLITGFSDENKINTAIEIYRKHYAKGAVYEAQLFDGIEQTLKAFSLMRLSLILVTGKAAPFAEMVIDHFKIKDYFKGVYAPGLHSKSHDKKDLIRSVMNDHGLSPENCIMIGDRHFDIHGARKCRVRSAGVLWGFGSKDELIKAGADIIIEKPADLAERLRPFFA